MSSYLGLPPIPADLKPITPYLQRAQETKSQDQIISYWCAYYAAQIGISLKATSAPNRTFLSALLSTLENLRKNLGSTDAITNESASSAYVENFALRVFTSADNEDRRGAATRNTAKKFLAASTFFDVLNVFEDRGPWEAHEEKVRYAKWRAIEITKALREGRQPTPVSASAGEEPVEPPSISTAVIESPSASAPTPSAPPPPLVLTDAPNDDAHFGHEQVDPYSTSVPVMPSASTAYDEGGTPFEVPPGPAPVPINVDQPEDHLDLLTGTSETPLPPALPQAPPTVDMEQGRGRSASIGATSLTSSPTTGAQRSISPTHLIPPDSPPSAASYLTGNLYPSAPPLPPPPSVPYVQAPPPPPTLLQASPPAELTPGLIGKAQKHCRFAISALDYEDAEQARKELRAALTLLGG